MSKSPNTDSPEDVQLSHNAERIIDETPDSSCSSTDESLAEGSIKFQQAAQILNSSTSNNNAHSNTVGSSLLVRFAKRVAICTAVVALARYAYPHILVQTITKLFLKI